jgi:hypothetical protein
LSSSALALAKRPCGRCGAHIDYSAPRFLSDDDDDDDDDETKTVNPESLVVATIVPPAQGKALGWGLEQINALSNKQPVHARCAKGSTGDIHESEEIPA